MEEKVWNKLIPTLVQIPQMNLDKKLWRTFRSQNSLETQYTGTQYFSLGLLCAFLQKLCNHIKKYLYFNQQCRVRQLHAIKHGIIFAK